MDEPRQADQLGLIHNSPLPIQDVALNTYREQWKIEAGGERDPNWRSDMVMMMKKVLFQTIYFNISTQYKFQNSSISTI